MRPLVALLLIVPLTSDSGWQVLTYRGIPVHDVRFSEDRLTMFVQQLVAPVIYPLPTTMTGQSVRTRGRLHGALNMSASQQGRPGFDDYALRLGLVELDTRRPGFLERRLAPP